MIAIKNIIIAVCLMLVPTMALAQASIDKIVDSLEDDKNVQDVMYSEQRDPSTRKVVKSSRIIQFSSDKIAAKLISAFKKEREKAISYKATNRPQNTVYELSFNDGKGFTAKYTLVQQGGSSWVLSVSVLHSRNRSRRSQKRDVKYKAEIDDCDDSFNNDSATLLTVVEHEDGGKKENCLWVKEDGAANSSVKIARETDNGCEIYEVTSYSSTGKSKKTVKRTVKHTSPSGKVSYHKYY